jgi:hypothetical protein
MTLTYHANVERWEDDADRNARVAKGSKGDLNRFLSVLRREAGAYLWVREFQDRGVVHYHVLVEGAVSEERVRVVWCRAIGALDDVHALRYGTKVEAIQSEKQARWYLGHYVGKARQKELPRGVAGAGRWWGRSRGLELAKLDEVVSSEGGTAWANPARVRVVRSARRFVGSVLGFKFRGGTLVSWSGRLVSRLQLVVNRLREFYGDVVSGETGDEVEGGEVKDVA